MNRSLISLILVLFICSCAKKVPVVSTKSVNKLPPTIKTTAASAKKIAKPLPLKKSAASKASAPVKILTTYQSTGNDVADIVVKLLGDKKFSLLMIIRSKEAGKKDDRILMGGSWKDESNRTVLLFDRRDVDVNALFDKAYATGEEFEILDTHRVAINNQLAVIHIWGVACERK